LSHGAMPGLSLRKMLCMQVCMRLEFHPARA